VELTGPFNTKVTLSWLIVESLVKETTKIMEKSSSELLKVQKYFDKNAWCPSKSIK